MPYSKLHLLFISLVLLFFKDRSAINVWQNGEFESSAHILHLYSCCDTINKVHVDKIFYNLGYQKLKAEIPDI